MTPPSETGLPAGGDQVARVRALAHDLRGMLHNISMAMELVAEKLPRRTPAGLRHLLAVAGSEAAAADRLVHQLAVLTRLQSGDRSWRDPQGRCDLVRAVAGAFTPAVTPGRQPWPTDLPPPGLAAPVDREAAALALSALRDGLAACTLQGEAATVSLSAAGVLTLHGPARWAEVLAAVHAALPGLPSPAAAPVPFRVLLHLAAAERVAADIGVRRVGPVAQAAGCHLEWHWPVYPPA